MFYKKKIGQMGEKIAKDYLMKNNYKIIKTNQKLGFDEIDIIAKDFNGTLVFVEVKTSMMTPENLFKPEDNMSRKKIGHFVRASEKFSLLYPELIQEEGWRMDLIAIQIKAKNLAVIRHYKNV